MNFYFFLKEWELAQFFNFKKIEEPDQAVIKEKLITAHPNWLTTPGTLLEPSANGGG
jgi:hypothetical protein